MTYDVMTGTLGKLKQQTQPVVVRKIILSNILVQAHV